MAWINNTFPSHGAGLWQQNGFDAESAAFGAYAAGIPGGTLGASDGYQPPWWGGATAGASYPPASVPGQGGIQGMLGQIVGLLQQLVGSMSGGFGPAPLSGQQQAAMPQPASATFSNATLSSTGDPHLAISGTQVQPGGATTQISDRYDSMSGQRNLFSTNDFGDAFRVSTTTTTPNANGVTYNASATATMDHGGASVTMGAGGAVSVTSNGAPVALAAGQSITLAGGEVVSESTGGAVSIAEQNANGEALTTTFSYNGSGVDVNATASGGVRLGGALVRHAVSGSGG